MIDFAYETYKLLDSTPDIKEFFEDRIVLMEYPETDSIKQPYIILSELMEPQGHVYGDNEIINYLHLIQVDIFVPVSDQFNGYQKCREMSTRINQLLKDKLKLANVGNSQPEYDDDYKLFRRVRRYEGISY